MVAPKKEEIPAGDAVGSNADGSINIGTPEQMKAKFDRAQLEDQAATSAFDEEGEVFDLVDKVQNAG